MHLEIGCELILLELAGPLGVLIDLHVWRPAKKQTVRSEFTAVMQVGVGSSPPADRPVERSFDRHCKRQRKSL